MNNRFRTTDWLLLVAVCAFFFFWKLSSFGLIGADEPRYAQVAREMLARHDFITPTLSGTAWLEKPPLYYWQAMATYRVFGVSDWAARLPSACDAFLLVLAVYWFLRRFRPGMELDGALILATSAGLVGYARAASMDMALAAAFGIAMLAWFAWFESGTRICLAVFYVGLALGLLAKGPVAPFLAALLITLFALSQKSIEIVKKTLWLPGILLFCAIGLPWYVAVQVRNPEFFHVFILEHNLSRFGTNLYHHPEPFWYYIPVTLLGWMPWSVFVAAALVWAIRRFRTPQQQALAEFLLIWIAMIVMFFSISRSKLPGYVLPAISAGAILVVEYLREKVGQKPPFAIAAFHGAALGSLLILQATVQFSLEHRFANSAESGWIFFSFAVLAGMALGVVLTVGAGVMLLLRRFRYENLRAISLPFAVATLSIALLHSGPTINATLSARGVAEALSQYDPHHLPVATFLVPRETEFGLAFYRDRVIPRYELGQVPDGEHLVVAAQGYPTGVSKAAGRKAVFLGNLATQKLDFFYLPAR